MRQALEINVYHSFHYFLISFKLNINIILLIKSYFPNWNIFSLC